MAVLGLSGDYHDAAAAVLVDGVVVAAAAQERFSRTKHDPDLPAEAASWCLAEAGIGSGDLAAVAFYDKPFTAWERVLSSQARSGPGGYPALRQAAPRWLGSKLWVGYRVERMLRGLGVPADRMVFAEHHQSHAAAAYYPSPFDHAAILTFDGVGEWATSTIAWGSGHRIEMRREQRFPDSLGLLYSAMTAFCGFEVNDGEYKLMGLAPYGEPRYAAVLRDRVVNVHDDGSIRLDQRWFRYRAGRRMTASGLDDLLDGPPSPLGTPPGQREADLARSVQVILEEAILNAARHAHQLTGERVACLAGGVALNCVANAKLRDEGPFDELWVQPAAGDDGSALGAALWAWHQLDDRPRPSPKGDAMSGAALGPGYRTDDVATWLEGQQVPFERIDDLDDLCRRVSGLLAAGQVVGWFRGRMEFGPRALGQRSILADPRDPEVARRINLAVKGRESFRPFAPAVLAEHADEWFDLDGHRSPYMLFTAAVSARHRIEHPEAEPDDFGERLARPRSSIPACTHVDGSARVQTVDRSVAPDFHRLIEHFHRRTTVPILVNTSFNRAAEPIVRTPAEALACHRAAGLDVLVLQDCLIVGDGRPSHEETP